MQSPKNNSEPLCVITGLAGVGKTTLLNAICGKSHQAGRAKGSVTRALFKNRTNVGNHSFDIMDTPGIDSKEETYKHAFLLKEALTACPLNTIFVIIQYENRFNKLIENYIKAESALFKYKDKIVVMISHWDLSLKREEEKNEITKMFKEDCGHDRIIFYSSHSDSASCIADQMCKYLCKMPKQQLEFSEEEFFRNFNIYEAKTQMFKSQQECFNEINNLDRTFRKLVTEAPQNSGEKDDFLHSLLVTFKAEIELLQEQFMKKYEQEMAQMEYYCLWVSLQKKCVQIATMLSDFIYRIMSYKLNDNQDPRNLVKRCPNCGEIWFKTEGCDGATNCGNVASKYHDNLTKPWTKFKFVRKQDGSFQWEKIAMKPISQPSDKPNKQDKLRVTKQKGCGAQFVWRDQAALEESLIIELFQVKSLEEVKAIFNKEDFKKIKDQANASIDTTIYS